jgi:hypothetical protein
MDLRHSLIPDDLIEDLLHSMPKHNGPDMEADRQVPKYDYISFGERMMDDHNQESSGATNGLGNENKSLQTNGVEERAFSRK